MRSVGKEEAEEEESERFFNAFKKSSCSSPPTTTTSFFSSFSFSPLFFNHSFILPSKLNSSSSCNNSLRPFKHSTISCNFFFIANTSSSLSPATLFLLKFNIFSLHSLFSINSSFQKTSWRKISTSELLG